MNNAWETLDPGFLAPIWLGVGALAAVALILIDIGAQRRRREAIAQFAAPSLVPGLTATLSGGRRLLKRVLLISAVALLFVAMARPHLLFSWSEEQRTGLDVLFAVDCSHSMLTEDVKPNRIERAKLAVQDFAEQVPDNRLGLVAFAGDAFLECPLTLDHDAFLTAVRDLDTETIPRPGTDIAAAIDEAVVALKSQPNNLKFMILVTDGEDLEGRVLDAAKTAAQAGLKIYTVGVGTAAGDVIPMRDDSGAVTFVHDADGAIVHSKLDEDKLREIARITGGAYEPLGQHGEGLSTIYNRYIASLPKQHLEEKREKVRYERFEWPLALATIFLIWEFLIRDRSGRSAPEVVAPASPNRPRMRRKPRVEPVGVALVLGLIWLGGLTGRAASTSDVAERDYKSGQYGSAEQNYQDAANAQPDRPDLQYDRGDAAYKAGQYIDAEDAFRKALNTPDLSLQENAYFNIGNAQLKHGEAMEKLNDTQRAKQFYQEAVHSYESALKLRDAHDTRYNYEVAKRKLEQQQQKQQQQQQQQQQNQQQQKQQNQSGQNQKGNQGQQQNQQNQSGQQQQNNQGQQQQGQNQQDQGQQPQQDQGNQGGQDQQQQGDKNATAQQKARSMERSQDQQDPGAKSREEAEALLDSLKDDEKRVTAASVNNGQQPPPTASGKDW